MSEVIAFPAEAAAGAALLDDEAIRAWEKAENGFDRVRALAQMILGRPVGRLAAYYRGPMDAETAEFASTLDGHLEAWEGHLERSLQAAGEARRRLRLARAE